jgi:predicted phage terminase large subunit-like protein
MSLVADLVACDRETGLSGRLIDFLKLAWPQVYPSSPFVMNWHYDFLCDHYEACFRGEIPELVVNLPPGGGKSSLTCVIWPAWVWIRMPEARMIYGAYGQKLVRRDAGDWLRFVQSPWFQRRWGDRFALPTVAAIDTIRNDKGGFRFGTTPGGEVTGWHAHFQVLDDPQKPEDMTKIGLENTAEWIRRTLDTRWVPFSKLKSRIVIMQRLHCDDAAQLHLDRGAMHVCLPAKYEPHRKCITPYGQDPRTEAGQMLDPRRMSEEDYRRKAKDLGGMNAAAQLQQRPVPEGGAVFKRDSLKYFFPNEGQVWDQVICSWDCGFKDEETSDFVCGQVWARAGANFYLLDQDLGHYGFKETCVRILALARKHNCATILVEDKANGPAIIETLRKQIPGVIAIDPQGGKFARANAVSGFFESGNVFLPDPKLLGYEWVDQAFVPELLTFPRSKNDDQVDACTQALNYLFQNTSYLKAAMAQVDKWFGGVA